MAPQAGTKSMRDAVGSKPPEPPKDAQPAPDGAEAPQAETDAEKAQALEATLAEHTSMKADSEQLAETLIELYPEDYDPETESPIAAAARILKDTKEANDRMTEEVAGVREENKSAKAAIARLTDQVKSLGKTPVASKEPPPPKPEKPKLYRAVKDGVWHHPTMGMQRVPKGKVFNALHYDIERIQKSGLELEEIKG